MSAADRQDDIGLSDVHTTTPDELREAHLRPTGQQHFDALTREEQDEMLGAAAAEKVRSGVITLADTLHRTAPGDTPGFIVQKPAQDL